MPLITHLVSDEDCERGSGQASPTTGHEVIGEGKDRDRTEKANRRSREF
jgi:hypothetical protein